MYKNNYFQNKPIIKFLFVLCFSFLICPAFSEDYSKKISVPNTETGDMTVEERAQAKRENTIYSVWDISTPSFIGKAFAIKSNQMIASFSLLPELLKDKGSLKDIFLTQSVSSSKLEIERILAVSALYGIVLFETKETVSNYLKLTDDDLLDPEEELSIVGYFDDALTTIKRTGTYFSAGGFFLFFSCECNRSSWSDWKSCPEYSR